MKTGHSGNCREFQAIGPPDDRRVPDRHAAAPSRPTAADGNPVEAAPGPAARAGLSILRIPGDFLNHPILKDNLPLILTVAAYVLAVYAVHWVFGIRDRLVLEFYYPWFARLAAIFSGIFFLVHICRGSWRRYLNPTSAAGFFMIFFLAPIFTTAFASYKQTIPLIHDFAWDQSLVRLDCFLHCGRHPWRLLEPLLSYPRIIRAVDVLYMLWFIVLFVSCLWMAWSGNRRLRLCFFMSTLLVWILLGSFLGTIFSSAGPCYYAQVLPSAENPFAPLMEKLQAIHASGRLYAIHNEAGLWEAGLLDVWMPFGGISAMPSIHLAMSTILTLLAFNLRRWIGWLAAGYTVVMQAGSVILGWHYAVDGYAGILLSACIWFAVARILKRPA